jgi:hypothetical protein
MLGLFSESKSPDDVFTPRESRVNPKMYIERPELESRLTSLLRGKLNIIIHGESGSGKSWLYKKVLSDLGATVMPLNLANASRLGSISAECANAVARTGATTLTGYTEKKSATASVGVLEGGLEHEKEFQTGVTEPFEACCALARRSAKKAPAVIVLDNLESIFEDDKLMRELANIITLLDDERYADYAVKLLIVGVPTGVRDYFSRTPNQATIANRLTELPEIGRLTSEQARQLVRRGFIDELQYTVDKDSLKAVEDHVLWVTDRIPQRLHEYCLDLAQIGVADRKLTTNMLTIADTRWIESSLSFNYQAIETLMNERDTKVGRRNQTLYVLGQMRDPEFRYSDVEAAIRYHFPESTTGVSMDVSTLLAHLAEAKTPILRRTPKGDSYQFRDPRFRMCIRVMLQKENATVKKVYIDTLSQRPD